MQGMLGTQPQGGFGALYFELLADWELRDPATFPGVIHTVEEQTSSTYAAQTADAVYGFAHAITRLIDADSVITGESMRNQLVLMADTATGYDGTTGRIYFDINGDRGTHFYDVVNLEGRTWNQVCCACIFAFYLGRGVAGNGNQTAIGMCACTHTSHTHTHFHTCALYTHPHA